MVVGLMALLAVGGAPVGASGPERARLWGTVTMNGAWYDHDGDGTSSVYPSLGWHEYAEYDLRYEELTSDEDSLRLDLVGVFNDSSYRSSLPGFVVERFRFEESRGSAADPWRIQVGDLYADFGYRTLQQSLKGVSLEVQPRLRGSGRMDSLMLTLGRRGVAWDDLGESTGFTGGLSVVTERGRYRRFGLTSVVDEGDGVDASGDVRQSVSSMAFERDLPFLGPRTVLEAEAARFLGDYLRSGLPVRDRADDGLFLQLANSGRRVLYRLRHEDYGGDFRPVGATITPDRRSDEGHLTWRLDGGDLGLRWQDYRDNQDGPDPTDTRILGLTAAWRRVGGWQGSLRAYRQDESDVLGLVDRSSDAVSGTLSHPVDERTTLRLTLAHDSTDDDLLGTSLGTTRDRRFALDRRFRWGRSRATARMGYGRRDVTTGPESSTEWLPTFALSWSRGPHSLELNVSEQRQDYATLTALDTERRDGGLRYRHRRGDTVVGLDYVVFRRTDDGGGDGRDYQVAAFLRRSFGRSLRHGDAVPSPAPAAADGELRLADLRPGADLADVLGVLAARGLIRPLIVEPFRVFETVWFDDVASRQRLALEEAQGGRLARAAVVVDVPPSMAGDGPVPGAHDYELIRRTLVRRYGAPTRVWEAGSASALDVLDWELDGRSLRLGVAVRLDGSRRIEVLTAATLPPPDDAAWALEGLP